MILVAKEQFRPRYKSKVSNYKKNDPFLQNPQNSSHIRVHYGDKATSYSLIAALLVLAIGKSVSFQLTKLRNSNGKNKIIFSGLQLQH